MMFCVVFVFFPYFVGFGRKALKIHQAPRLRRLAIEKLKKESEAAAQAHHPAARAHH